MEEQTNKPSKGTWDRLGNSDESTKLPKISFEINIPQTVTFLEDFPRELESRDDPTTVFYVFSVEQEKQEKEFNSSAWTLLGALKALVPLKGKTVTITKKLVKGRQMFEVSNVTV